MCRAERPPAPARTRSPSPATLKCPATSATCPPPASRGPAYRLRHPAGTVAEHISRKPYQAATPAAELAEERTAREVAGRSRDAELEAAQARSALLEGQLASAGQARDRALADLQAARQ